MNHDATAACPRIEDISALMDDALDAPAGAAMKAHAAVCPLCGAKLRELEAISARMRGLRDARCDVDLAALIRPRLRPRAPAKARAPRWGRAAQLAPRGLGAAGALAAGAYLGLMLVSGGSAALRPAAMTVFDAAPPGALCAGLARCTPRER